MIYLPSSIRPDASKEGDDEKGRGDTATRKINHQDAAGLLVEVGVFLVPFEAGALEEACYLFIYIS